jgi:ssDNA-binding Zn-finger/Zn-ribbon topoisomerase 1
MGIGTKATRHTTLEKLYDRGYVESDPPRPTRLARAVVEAAEEFADPIVSEEMTARLEADMAAISRGERELTDVTAESRAMLGSIFERLIDSSDAVGEHLRESLKADRTLGPCPESDHDLLVREARDGSRFVGCDGYPDCEYTLPLPSTGRPILLDESCDEHGLAHVKMLAGRKTFVHGCPRCAAERADASEDRLIGACPECGADGDEGLAIKRLRSGARLVGCTRYPDCEYSLPLPRRGEIEVEDERWPEHDLPHLQVVDDGDGEPWALGCPICNYREYRARQAGGELETVEGIGEATAEKLAAAGVEDAASLKAAEPAPPTPSTGSAPTPSGTGRPRPTSASTPAARHPRRGGARRRRGLCRPPDRGSALPAGRDRRRPPRLLAHRGRRRPLDRRLRPRPPADPRVTRGRARPDREPDRRPRDDRPTGLAGVPERGPGLARARSRPRGPDDRDGTRGRVGELERARRAVGGRRRRTDPAGPLRRRRPRGRGRCGRRPRGAGAGAGEDGWPSGQSR